MRTKIIVLVNGGTQEQLNAISFAVRASRAGWWHWFSQGWLINDNQGRGHNWWRTLATQAAPGLHLVVLQIDGSVSWSAFGKAEHFAWLGNIGWDHFD